VDRDDEEWFLFYFGFGSGIGQILLCTFSHLALHAVQARVPAFCRAFKKISVHWK